MSKKFQDHYSIEYLHPGKVDSPNNKKKGFILLSVVLLALGSLGFYIWKQGIFDQFLQNREEQVVATQRQEDPVEEKTPTAKIVFVNENTNPKNDNKARMIKVSNPVQKTLLK